MNKKMLIALVLCYSNFLAAQIGLGDRIIVGFSPTYIFDVNNLDPSLRHYEMNYNLNATVSLSNSLYVGAQYIYTNTWGSTISNQSNKDQYYHMGVFLQWDLLANRNFKSRLYPELSYNLSNYCTCGLGDPFKKSGLHKIGAGLSWDFVLTKRLVLETGFYNYVMLNKRDIDTYNYTQYILGISYNFGKPYY